MLALTAVMRQLDGDQEWQIGDRALTLQMLNGVASELALCTRAELNHALDRLDLLPTRFPAGLPLDLGMSRLDALHLRAAHGLTTRDFDPSELSSYIESVEQAHGLLAAWLMRRQARALGVESGSEPGERYPFAGTSWMLHLYFLTHLVMLDSDFFLQPVRPARFEDELAQLKRAIPFLISGHHWDLLGETQLCLAACGVSCPSANAALLKAQRTDGSWSEKGQDARQTAHTSASCLLGLAAWESLQAKERR